MGAEVFFLSAHFLFTGGLMNPFTQPTVAAPSKSYARSALLCSGVCFALLGSAYANTAYAVDVNAATAAQLDAVRGIGPKTAQVIVDERTRGGRFESMEDLSDRVKGIGRAKLATLRSAGLTLGGGMTVLPGSEAGKHSPVQTTADSRGKAPADVRAKASVQSRDKPAAGKADKPYK